MPSRNLSSAACSASDQHYSTSCKETSSQISSLPSLLKQVSIHLECDFAKLGVVCCQVALAQQVYDYVDQRIRRLDKDTKAFDSEMARERARLGLPVSACLPKGGLASVRLWQPGVLQRRLYGKSQGDRTE